MRVLQADEMSEMAYRMSAAILAVSLICERM
jgi:hypothetical protein